jgi:hypothetical protein
LTVVALDLPLFLATTVKVKVWLTDACVGLTDRLSAMFGPWVGVTVGVRVGVLEGVKVIVGVGETVRVGVTEAVDVLLGVGLIVALR